MQNINTAIVGGGEGIHQQKLPFFQQASEPTPLSSLNWNENINICQNSQLFQKQEFNQFYGIVPFTDISTDFLQQNQQIYEEHKIQTQNNSVLLDLQTNSLSDQFSSYSNMIGENDNYLTQQLNSIQSAQQNELLLITTPTSSSKLTSKSPTEFPLYPPTSLNNPNFLLQQSSPSLPLTKQFSSLEFTEQQTKIFNNNSNNIPQFLSNNSNINSTDNLSISSNRKSNLVNTKKSLTSRRLNGGIQASTRKRRRERFNNTNQLICETKQLNQILNIDGNNEKEKALLYQQIGLLKANNMLKDLTKSEQLSNTQSPTAINEENKLNIPPICIHCSEQIQEPEMLLLKKKEIKLNEIISENNLNLKEENIQQQKQQFYHLKCLNCSVCNLDLESEDKCFVKDKIIYCCNCYAKHAKTMTE
uniref:LIM zinc-binding domain-containing protein n=2 Tax=Meloidogyne incognita TaxID=6306 RepID=A0A914M9X4_MELIC